MQMRVVILAGGLGTRLQEETSVKPKPMVEIGGRPMLWHIMNICASYGLREFVVALGYKGEVIKDYFVNYYHRRNGTTVHLGTGQVDVHGGVCEDWVVHLVDTGATTQTGGRIKQLASSVGTGTFMVTYGDAVANVDLGALLEFHRGHGRLVTVTAVRPPARFGALNLEGDQVVSFEEKPQAGDGWINGGFFALEPAALDYIHGDDTVFERSPLERLAQDGQLMAFRHSGFWQCMDTLRDVRLLEELWNSGTPPWRVWPS